MPWLAVFVKRGSPRGGGPSSCCRIRPEEDDETNYTYYQRTDQMMGNLLSAIVAVVYLGVAYVSGGAEAVIVCLLYLVLPLACIWFSEAMGEFTGIARGHLVTSTSPGWAVAGMGWILLLLPVVVGLYFMSQG